MDPLTQASLGAAVAIACCPRDQTRWAAFIGAVAGAAPDLDVLIRSASDPLLSLQYHRHFTHALISAPLIGLCVAGLFKLLFYRAKVTFREWALYAILGALTHGLLDACTSYGTLLYWPFNYHRESWDLISVIDPLFTLPLAFLTLFAFAWRRPRFAQVALVLCALYFGFCGVQRSKATQMAQQLAEARGHVPQRYSIRPSFGNVLLWRLIYEFEGRYYVDAVSILPGAAPRFYEGTSVEHFTVADAAATVAPESVLGRDIERFRFFSQGFLYQHPTEPDVVGDVRYAMWPDSVVPLWGIRIDPAKADAHTEMVHYRDPSKPSRDRLWEMICGRDVPAQE
ncbi:MULTISPECIES: metal-dependent hydrolase [unclassified Lentimonas]|uniref:metal-dependent hydrolase n=1 Tax=unclassified Lentimonas TaxID=2630993 RepID=UPI00132815ED|nr:MULTISPECIES: metal-dependent hydrolase [unclassified Lentimonas]CAA6679882.1 Integral membrane protein [Lentimonas sp. CC4]CAA6685604.1 Integral membrane protein [Lentimonas sp. CC6]CAA6689651.1 Integral membrane protein [Lentimonas sp. CC19]CAA6692655.1 Integral membrane protein [Lentimonas sp. CC10]CAA7069241.1 Integral membrane protein [Lentimonas sp. CC11]